MEYVRVSGADWARLGADAERFAHFIGNRAFMRMTDGRCAALEVRELEGAYFCTIYDRRPQTCRDLGRGSPQCEAERIRKDTAARAAITLRASGRPLPPPAWSSPKEA